MSSKQQSAGFTLVELVVATTLTVLVAGSTVAILRSTSVACERADKQLELQQQARAGVLAIATALRNAQREGGDEARLTGLDDWIDDRRRERPADRVRFFTISGKTIRWGQPESDVKECEFFLKEPIDGKLPALMRRTDSTRNEKPDGGGVVELVAENVLGLNLEYHDGVDWCEDWPEDTRGWPVAVRIELAVLNKEEPRQVWTTSRMINFPYYPAPSESEEE